MRRYKVFFLLLLSIFGCEKSSVQPKGNRPQLPVNKPTDPTGPVNPPVPNPVTPPPSNVTEFKTKVIHQEKRIDLNNNNLSGLHDIINNMKTARKDKQSKETITNKKFLYAHALQTYVNNILPSMGDENVVVAAPKTMLVPSRDLAISKIHAIKLANTTDYMKYFDDVTTQSKRVKDYLGSDVDVLDYVVIYLDFANASLGGGAFGRGLVQEETMFLLCPELPLYTSMNKGEYIADADLVSPDKFKFTTRTTRSTSALSPSPKYFANIRCVLAPKGNLDRDIRDQFWQWNIFDKVQNYFDEVMNPAMINIAALAVTEISRRADTSIKEYSYADAEDFFNNVYVAFDLSVNYNEEHHKDKKLLIFGGRLGAGAFGHNANFSAAMQILVAKLLGVDLILTGIDDALRGDAEKEVNDLLSKHPVGTKFDTLLQAFVDQIKGNANYLLK